LKKSYASKASHVPMNAPLMKKPSYREQILKKMNEESSRQRGSQWKVIVKIRDETISDWPTSEEFLRTLRYDDKMRAQKFKIHSMIAVSKTRILVICDTQSTSQRVKDFVNQNFPNYEAFFASETLPMVRLCGVAQGCEPEQIVDDLLYFNEFLSPFKSELKLASVKNPRSRNSQYRDLYRDAVLEVSPRVCKVLLEAGKVHLPGQIVRVQPYSRFIQCLRCFEFGHTSGGKHPCMNSTRCLKCGGEHEQKDCQYEGSQRCSNCIKYNESLAKSSVVGGIRGNRENSGKLDCNHFVKSRDCPLLKKAMALVEKRTNYSAGVQKEHSLIQM